MKNSLGNKAAPQEKTKAEGVELTPSAAIVSTTKRLNSNTKKIKLLAEFVSLGELGMNCFEAAIYHGDYVLRTTVSELQRDCGLEFSRKYEQVPNKYGSLTSCVRYWLDEANRATAKVVIESTAGLKG